MRSETLGGSAQLLLTHVAIALNSSVIIDIMRIDGERVINCIRPFQ